MVPPAGEGRGTDVISTGARRVAIVAAVLVALVAMGQAAWVHHRTGQWGLSVSGAMAPSRVHWHGRDYDRGGPVRLPRAAVRSGSTPGGGVIYVREVGDLAIFVKAGDRTWGYGLVGGP
jgi:hypothetical protein